MPPAISPPKLPCKAGESPFHIKGPSYRGLVAATNATIGLERFCDALPEELHAFVRQPFLASGRYDVLPMYPLMHAFARLRGVPFEPFVRESTATQAHYDSKHVYKMIFDAHDPREVALRIARFNSQVYDYGEYFAEVPRPGYLVLEMSFIPAYIEPWFRPMHAAYAESALKIAGAKRSAVVSQTTIDAGSRDGFPLRSFRTEIEWA